MEAANVLLSFLAILIDCRRVVRTGRSPSRRCACKDKEGKRRREGAQRFHTAAEQCHAYLANRIRTLRSVMEC